MDERISAARQARRLRRVGRRREQHPSSSSIPAAAAAAAASQPQPQQQQHPSRSSSRSIPASIPSAAAAAAAASQPASHPPPQQQQQHPSQQQQHPSRSIPASKGDDSMRHYSSTRSRYLQVHHSRMKEGSKRRRSSSPGGTRMRVGKRSRSWSPDEDEDECTAGWAPVPGKIHPAIGLDEVEAKRLYGLRPTRTLDVPLDDDGYRSDVFFCDRAAYRVLNDALARGTQLGAWVRNGLRLGILFVHRNYDKVPGWRVISFLGRHAAAVPSRGKQVVLELLKLHSQEGDAACVESAKLFADAHGDKDVRGCSFNYVFVCGNTKFAELLRKDFAGVQQFLVKGRAVDKPRNVLFRLWHVTSESSAQTEEECLDERWKDYAYHERSWWCVRECVPYQ